MNNEKDVVTASSCVAYSWQPIRWSAIFAGALIGVGLGFLLQLYGMAIAIGAWSSTPDGAMVIAAGGVLGLLVGVITSMVASGYATGYLARAQGIHKHLGIVYGFTMWSVALLLSALMVMPVSHYMSNYSKSLAPAGKEMADKMSTAKRTSGQSTDNSGNSNNSSNSNSSNEMATSIPPDQKAVWSAWIIFALFFAGAISACVGACWGLGCRSADKNVHRTGIID